MPCRGQIITTDLTGRSNLPNRQGGDAAAEAVLLPLLMTQWVLRHLPRNITGDRSLKLHRTSRFSAARRPAGSRHVRASGSWRSAASSWRARWRTSAAAPQKMRGWLSRGRLLGARWRRCVSWRMQEGWRSKNSEILSPSGYIDAMSRRWGIVSSWKCNVNL